MYFLYQTLIIVNHLLKNSEFNKYIYLNFDKLNLFRYSNKLLEMPTYNSILNY